eukprot:2227073-Rhodomonas_salina.1
MSSIVNPTSYRFLAPSHARRGEYHEEDREPDLVQILWDHVPHQPANRQRGRDPVQRRQPRQYQRVCVAASVGCYAAHLPAVVLVALEVTAAYISPPLLPSDSSTHKKEQKEEEKRRRERYQLTAGAATQRYCERPRKNQMQAAKWRVRHTMRSNQSSFARMVWAVDAFVGRVPKSKHILTTRRKDATSAETPHTHASQSSGSTASITAQLIFRSVRYRLVTQVLREFL